MRLRICFLILLVLATGCRNRAVPSAETTESGAVSQVREENPGKTAAEKQNVPEHRPLLRPDDRTPLDVLERMAAAYKSAETYSDHGVIRIVGQMTNPEDEPATWPCTVAFQKPGRLRLEVNEGMLVSDGEDCFAQVRTLPNQVLRFPTSRPLAIKTIFRDVFLDRAMELGIPGEIFRFPPQLILLLADKPLKTFLPEGAVTEFLDPQWLKESPCDLVRISHASGNRILWINRNDGALLRFDYLVEGFPVPEGVESIRLIRFDLGDAGFDRKIAPEAFQMMQPAGALQLTEFQPIEMFLLGHPLKDPETLGLEKIVPSGPENDAETIFPLAERNKETVVLCFWTTWSDPSKAALLEMARVAETFPGDDRIRFFAVNLDDLYPSRQHGDDDSARSVGDAASNISDIRETLASLKVEIPVWKDKEGRWTETFLIDSFPTSVIVGPGGRTEFYFRGLVPAAMLGDAVREVLSGGKPHEKGLALFLQWRREHETMLQWMSEEDLYSLSALTDGTGTMPEAAPPKPPATFSLEERWTLQTLTDPGNIALFPGSAQPGSSREEGETPGQMFLIPCDGNQLACIDGSGNLLWKLRPEGVRHDELLTLVRTGVDAIGKRYIGVSSVSGSAVHVFDETLKPILSYVPDEVRPDASTLSGIRNGRPKRVVSDFQFADIEGNGTQSLLLGILGLDDSGPGFDDSIRAVTMQGEEIWRDDTVSSPFQVHSFMTGGKRGVFSLDVRQQRSSLLRFDSQGKRLEPLEIEENLQVLWFDVADLDGDMQTDLCAVLSNLERKEFYVAGLDDQGKILWRHPLADVEYRHPIEQIFTGDVVGDACEEWIVPAPDGTVSVYDGRGRLLDSFAFGVLPTGMAVVKAGEKRLLIVAADDHASPTGASVTAWEIVDN